MGTPPRAVDRRSSASWARCRWAGAWGWRSVLVLLLAVVLITSCGSASGSGGPDSVGLGRTDPNVVPEVEPESNPGAASTPDVERGQEPPAVSTPSAPETSAIDPAGPFRILQSEGLADVSFGADSERAIAAASAAGLGAASHDTGWRQDFYIHAGPFGGVVGFQRSYWAYRRTCWFADSFCLLSGRRIADDAEVFVGWSVGPAGWVSEPEVSSRATTAEGITVGTQASELSSRFPLRSLAARRGSPDTKEHTAVSWQRSGNYLARHRIRRPSTFVASVRAST